MAKQTKVTKPIKNDKATLHEAILLLEITISEYKAERKAHWKSFKDKMNEELDKIRQTVNEMPVKDTIKSKKL